jgi:hypothetical protein
MSRQPSDKKKLSPGKEAWKAKLYDYGLGVSAYEPSADCREELIAALKELADEHFFAGLSHLVARWGASEAFTHLKGRKNNLEKEFLRLEEPLAKFLEEWNKIQFAGMISTAVATDGAYFNRKQFTEMANALLATLTVGRIFYTHEGKPGPLPKDARTAFIVHLATMLNMRGARITKQENGVLSLILQAVFADLGMPEITNLSQLIKNTLPNGTYRQHLALVKAVEGDTNLDWMDQFVPRP